MSRKVEYNSADVLESLSFGYSPEHTKDGRTMEFTDRFPPDMVTQHIANLVEQGHMQSEDIQSYTFDQLNKALLEFVFKTPYTKTSYVEDAGKLHYPYIQRPAEDIYAETAELVTNYSYEDLKHMSGETLQHLPREAAEGVSFSTQIQASVLENKADTVFYLSPPPDGGDHTFLMVFTNDPAKQDGNEITNHIIRIEQENNLTELFDIHSSIHARMAMCGHEPMACTHVPRSIRNEKGFLLSPLVYNTAQTNISDVLGMIGIDGSIIQEGEEYEHLMMSDERLMNHVQTYLSITHAQVMSGNVDVSALNPVLSKITRRAKRLKELHEEAEVRGYNDYDFSYDETYADDTRVDYSSDCPTAVAQDMMMGRFFEEMTLKEKKNYVRKKKEEEYWKAVQQLRALRIYPDKRKFIDEKGESKCPDCGVQVEFNVLDVQMHCRLRCGCGKQMTDPCGLISVILNSEPA